MAIADTLATYLGSRVNQAGIYTVQQLHDFIVSAVSGVNLAIRSNMSVVANEVLPNNISTDFQELLILKALENVLVGRSFQVSDKSMTVKDGDRSITMRPAADLLKILDHVRSTFDQKANAYLMRQGGVGLLPAEDGNAFQVENPALTDPPDGGLVR